MLILCFGKAQGKLFSPLSESERKGKCKGTTFMGEGGRTKPTKVRHSPLSPNGFPSALSFPNTPHPLCRTFNSHRMLFCRKAAKTSQVLGAERKRKQKAPLSWENLSRNKASKATPTKPPLTAIDRIPPCLTVGE